MTPTPADDRRRRAYAGGANFARRRMEAEAPLDAAALDAVTAADVVVAQGAFDHVERVLDALELPYTAVPDRRLHEVRLRPEQLVVVNCPGDVDPGAIPQLRRFVAEGGSLFTTDWALLHVIERAFPGVIAHNGVRTADTVVRIEGAGHDNPFLHGVLDPGDEPLWWLEASSYPIRILDPARVTVLLRSGELERSWGEAPVAVTFRHGEGEVFHMISHYYLQRTETRTARDAAPAGGYVAGKGVCADASLTADLRGLTVAELESAASSARGLANVIARRKRRNTGS